MGQGGTALTGWLIGVVRMQGYQVERLPRLTVGSRILPSDQFLQAPPTTSVHGDAIYTVAVMAQLLDRRRRAGRGLDLVGLEKDGWTKTRQGLRCASEDLCLNALDIYLHDLEAGNF